MEKLLGGGFDWDLRDGGLVKVVKSGRVDWFVRRVALFLPSFFVLLLWFCLSILSHLILNTPSSLPVSFGLSASTVQLARI